MIKSLIMIAILTLNVGCSFKIPEPPWVETSLKISPITRTNYDTSVDAQLATLTRQVTKQLSGLACKDIGILQVVDLEGEEGTFEKYIKDELVNRLSRTFKFRVFPIDELTEGIVESRKSLTEKILHFFKREPVYLTGTTVNLPKGVKVSIQITSIQSGQILGTASMLFRKDRSLLALMDQDGGMLVGAGVNNISNISRFRDHLTGKVIKVSDNDYVELIRNVYTLYIKRINFEYNLFTDEESTVEIFLNDDYRVMSTGDMVNFSYGSHQFVLSLQRVMDHRALFTFANLTEMDDNDSETITSLEWKNNHNISAKIIQSGTIQNKILLSGLVTQFGSEKMTEPIELPIKHGFVFMVSVATPLRRKHLQKLILKYLT